MKFKINECKNKEGFIFDGLYEIFPEIIRDERGYFTEIYRENDFLNTGLTMKFVQDNQSESVRGVIRGLHFQKKHVQGKLVRVVSGLIYDVAVDLRKGRSTYGTYYGVLLDGMKQNMLYIPEGFAHGFAVLSENAVFSYKCTDYYHPEDESGIIWNDPIINIDWNSILGNIKPVLSEKDSLNPYFDKQNSYFDKNGIWINKE